MNVLVACEFSGIVRDAFTRKGHSAISCDLLPSEKEGQHIQHDVRIILNINFDLLIAHPPCTYLCISGNRWMNDKKRFPNREQDRQSAIDFFMLFANSHIPKICIENPVGIMSKLYKKPTQTIQPWEFGHPENKLTCLWLKNLPKLKPTKLVYVDPDIALANRIHHMQPGKERSRLRSLTYIGIANAMAEQWG